MSTSEGSIRAQLSLDLAAFQADITKALALSNQLGKGLKDVPPAAPRIQTAALDADSIAARRSLQALSVELGGLPGISGRVSSQLLGVGGSAGAMGVAIAGSAALVASLATAMAASIKSAADLEQSLASVKSIKLDLDTKTAEDSLHRISTSIGASAVDLSKALYDIFSSIDVPQEQAIELLDQFSKGAIAAQTDTKTFGTSIIGVMNAFGKSTEDTSHITDLFFNTVKAGVVTGPQLANGLGSVASAGSLAGQGIDETFAAIVAVTKVGKPAAEALNDLTNLYSKLPTKDAAKNFAELGISVVDSNGKLRQAQDLARDFIAKTAGMSEAAKAAAKVELFPDIQARAGFDALIKKLEDADKALATNRGETGSTAEAYAILAATSQQNLARFQASITALADTFGATLLPAVNVGVDALTALVAKFGDAGRGIDAFLASDGVRGLAGLGIRVAQGVGGAAQAVGDAELEFERGVRAAATGQAPERVITPTAAQAEGAVQVGAGAAGVAAVAGLTEAERALVEQHRARIAAEAQLEALDAALQAANALVETSTEGVADATEQVAGAAAQAVPAQAALLSLVERLTAGLASGIGVQVNWNEEIQKALGPTSAIAEEMRGPYLEGLLKAKQATDDLAKISQIRDAGIAAQALQLQDAAAKETDVTAAQEKQAAASAFVLAAIDAQTKGHEAATASAAALVKPLETLSSAILPALTAQQAAQVAATQKTEGSYAALAQAASLAGIDIGKYGDLTQLTGAQLAQVKAEVEAAAKGFAGFLKEEDTSRISGAIGTLVSGTSDVTAAQVKQLQASGDQAGALTVLAGAYGVSAEQAATWTEGLKAGGGAAAVVRQEIQLLTVQMQLLAASAPGAHEAAVALFEAQERLTALTALTRDPTTGVIRLKVDVDIEAAQKAVYDLQTAFREASAERARAESKATHEFGIQQQATTARNDQARAAYGQSVLGIGRAREDSSEKLGADIQSAVTTQNEAAYKIDTQLEDAAATLEEKRSDTTAKYEQAVQDAADSLVQGYEGVAERTRGVMQQATEAAQQALRQVSGAMQSFNDQARITANATSIQQEQSRLASYGFTDFQSRQSALRAAEIQAEGTAGLAQVAGANQLNQTLVGANQSLQKATEKAGDEMGKLTKETAKLIAAYQKTSDKALTAATEADDDAQTAYAKTARDANEALQRNTRAAEKAMVKAQEEDRKRQKALDDKANDEQAKEWKRLQDIALEREQDPEGKGRLKAERDFEDAERARRKAQRDAEAKFADDLKKADAQLAALLALKASIDANPERTAEAMAARVKIGEQQFLAGAQITNLETQVDFLSASIGEFARQSRKG